MDLYMDEKWKFSKSKSSRNSSSTAKRSSADHVGSGGSNLRKSSSLREAARGPTRTPRSFSNRCAGLVKEQRARFYIVRRCVTMLICWRDYP